MNNDDDDVVNQKQQLSKKKTSVDVSYLLYRKIDSYLFKKYFDTNLSYEEKLKEIDYIFSLGLEKAERDLGCPILFEEKKPRKDVLINLGKMAYEFLIHPQYPIIQSMVVTKTINRIMDSRDNRTKEKYKKCIIQYTKNSGEVGSVDISFFVERVPTQYLSTTSSTSSFNGNKHE